MPRGLRTLAATLPLLGALAFTAVFVLVPLGAMLLETIWTGSGVDFGAYGDLLQGPAPLQLMRSMALGLVGTGIAIAFGFGHAWLTFRTDLPGSGWLGPLGIAPLVMPPIVVAMGFTDLVHASGFWVCALLLGTCYAPFVAVMTARGLRAVDGRIYESALMARGPGAAGRLLLRAILPEISAGALFAFIFIVAEHGVPEFLTVKGKHWLTYAEGIFSRWNLRMSLGNHEAVANATVTALPLIAIIAVALVLALRLRADATVTGDFRPLPVRRLGRARVPACVVPMLYLGLGVMLPVVVMLRWAAGSTRYDSPLSVARLADSFRGAFQEAGSDLGYTLVVGGLTTVLVLLVAVPMARAAANGRRIFEYLPVLAVAVPAILLAIGLVKVFNRDSFGAFYDSAWIVVCAYGARFLPFAVLTLSQMVGRVPRELGEAALLSGRGLWARTGCIALPLLAPAIWSASCLIFILALRELDMAVVLPAGNDMVVRRLANIVHYGGEETGGALAILLLLTATIAPLATILVSGRRLQSIS